MTPPGGRRPYSWNPLRWALPWRVLLGVMVGISLGGWFKREPLLWGWTTADCGTLAGLYIQFLTAMATPLIFVAILDAFVHTEISGRQGAKMALICCLNIGVAFGIGLTILNVWQPGKSWHSTFESLATQGSAAPLKDAPIWPEPTKRPSLSPLEMLKTYVPKSVVQPFLENTVLTVAALAILVGAALRTLKREREDLADVLLVCERFASGCYQLLLKLLEWLIELAPFAICLAVTGVVGGTEDLGQLMERVGVFFVTVMAALGLHALVYYPLSAWFLGGKSPRVYFGEGSGAILTGLSINSSLATAPLTLTALKRMGVSDASARLSACVGTNFNNDGITLYEAITALFIAQAVGMELNLATQVSILVAALAGSMGIAGIPNSGLIILSLVLQAARLPEEVINLALPIVYSIDFINARVRSAVNVMGDMQVAILLDAGERATCDPRA